jgi:hypothetical protein
VISDPLLSAAARSIVLGDVTTVTAAKILLSNCPTRRKWVCIKGLGRTRKTSVLKTFVAQGVSIIRAAAALNRTTAGIRAQHESWELRSRQRGRFAGNGRIRLRCGGNGLFYLPAPSKFQISASAAISIMHMMMRRPMRFIEYSAKSRQHGTMPYQRSRGSR